MNISIPSNNVFSPQSLIIAGPDTSTLGLVVYSAALGPGGNPFTGSGLLAQLRLNVTTAAPPVFSNVEFEGVEGYTDTFLLQPDLSIIGFTTIASTYAYTNVVTHSVPYQPTLW